MVKKKLRKDLFVYEIFQMPTRPIKLKESQITAYQAKIGVYKVMQTYRIEISSRFILTQKAIKDALGIGYEILSVEKLKDIDADNIILNVDTAAVTIINTGYRALARAFHPDLGGDPEKMRLINQTKKELIDLVKSLGE